MSDSCNPMDCSPTGSSIHGILQYLHGILQYLHGILEWVAVSFSRGSSWSSDQTISCIGKWILYHWATGKPICECAVLCLVTQLCPTLCDPMNGSPPGSSVRGDSLGREYGSGLPCPSPGDRPNPGIEPRSPALQVDSLPSEPPGKPMNTGVGSLSFLQEIFLTQELNQGLLHCRQILKQLATREALWVCRYAQKHVSEVNSCLGLSGAFLRVINLLMLS